MKSLFAISCVALLAKPANAADITVTCDGLDTNNLCITSPSAGAAAFDKDESDNINMLPGDAIERTIILNNTSANPCIMTLRKIYNVDETPSDFSTKMWTALQTKTGIPFGNVVNGQATNAKTLRELVELENLAITNIPAHSTEEMKWLIKFDPITGNSYQRSRMEFDFDMVFECPQDLTATLFTISKNNSSWPAKLTPGDEIIYQLTIRAQNGPVQNVYVVDAPSESIKYVKGSWTANSNIRGDIKANHQVTEPSYQSPGVWELEDMAKNEIVTLSYRAIVEDTATNGIYKDLAWAYGELNNEVILAGEGENNESNSEKIPATSVESDFEIDGGIITDTFVGTQILVDKPIEPVTKKVTIKTKEIEEESDVLGTTTQSLPATGANLFITIGLAFLAILGTLVTIISAKKAKSYILLAAIGLTIFTTLTTKEAYAQESLFLRVSEPRTPDNQAFIVDYVVLDTDKDYVNITCEKKNPADTFFTLLNKTTTKAGGDSGICAIKESDFGTEGTYTVKVSAQANTKEASEEVAVLYKSTGPKKPSYIEKEKIDSCEYKIRIKTSEDKNISYIEIYRSSKKDFTVGASTRIKTVDIGPNEVYKFTHKLYGNDCGNSYYAVRAFDAAGNPSDVRTEVIEKTITVESGTKVVETQEGILPGTSETNISGEITEEPEGIEVATEETGEKEEVAGATKIDESTEEQQEVLGARDTKNITIQLLLMALIAFIAYSVVKSKRGKAKSQQ